MQQVKQITHGEGQVEAYKRDIIPPFRLNKKSKFLGFGTIKRYRSLTDTQIPGCQCRVCVGNQWAGGDLQKEQAKPGIHDIVQAGISPKVSSFVFFMPDQTPLKSWQKK